MTNMSSTMRFMSFVTNIKSEQQIPNHSGISTNPDHTIPQKKPRNIITPLLRTPRLNNPLNNPHKEHEKATYPSKLTQKMRRK